MAKKNEIDMTVRFIKLPEVKRITSLSMTEIYRRIGKGQFPKQIRVGPKSVVWVEREVRAWVDLMVAGRDDQ
ncbi:MULTISPECIES: helix-turn-helix transcriptional regulator [Pseudomonas]|uniref:Transcriptional regulator, AlpA family n=1 Tax=Pseudomonas lutea TaxID=243924 RepID=A0A9X8MHV0_9PSED|nr:MULTISPECIES: AlpA family phage regulatory protein [Pseudomonas]SER51229.1 transcriptional regulator, AlpA family [Pseudomonas lutea]